MNNIDLLNQELVLKTIFKEIKSEIKERFPMLNYRVTTRKMNHKTLAMYRRGSYSINENNCMSISINSKIINIIEYHELLDTYDHDYYTILKQHLTDTICHEIVHGMQEAVQIGFTNKSIWSVKFNEDEAEDLGRRFLDSNICDEVLFCDFLNLYRY